MQCITHEFARYSCSIRCPVRAKGRSLLPRKIPRMRHPVTAKCRYTRFSTREDISDCEKRNFFSAAPLDPVTGEELSR